MRGETVIVRAYGGIPLIRRIWDIGEDVIYIVADSQFGLLVKNDPKAISPIGFPKEDVFKFDRKIANSICNISRNEFDWNKLSRFEAA